MPVYGTLSNIDDLVDNNALIADFGEQQLADRFAAALAIHNQAFSEMINDFAFVTGDALLPWGGADSAIIDELDEWGAADASKTEAAGNIGLPLRIYGGTVQWTRTWMLTHTVSKMTKQMDAFAGADLARFTTAMRAALFKPTNNLAYKDRLVTGLTLPLVALLNADGSDVPEGPNGETFNGATHTHYTASASLTETALSALIENVIEHGVTGTMRLYISRADEATVQGMTGFSRYLEANVTVLNLQVVGNGVLDPTNPNDRAIGSFHGVEVWVKPWIPANYQLAMDFAGTESVIGIRTRSGSLTGTAAFQVVAENEQYPLRAQNVGREYGVGIVGRHKAAINYSAGATYVAPTF